MSTLIPNVQWKDFKKIADEGKLSQLKSCEVEIDGYTFTAIIPMGDTFTKDYARTQADFLALRSNSVGGFDPEELLKGEEPEKYPNLAKARAVRKAKREASLATV